eukprot:6489751-Amphidinium_carterae.2
MGSACTRVEAEELCAPTCNAAIEDSWVMPCVCPLHHNQKMNTLHRRFETERESCVLNGVCTATWGNPQWKARAGGSLLSETTGRLRKCQPSQVNLMNAL